MTVRTVCDSTTIFIFFFSYFQQCNLGLVSTAVCPIYFEGHMTLKGTNVPVLYFFFFFYMGHHFKCLNLQLVYYISSYGWI